VTAGGGKNCANSIAGCPDKLRLECFKNLKKYKNKFQLSNFIRKIQLKCDKNAL